MISAALVLLFLGSPGVQERSHFNQRALQHHLPLFWVQDRNGDGEVDPEELAITWPGEEADWLNEGSFTERSRAALRLIRAPEPLLEALEPQEHARRQAVLKALDLGQRSLVASDFRMEGPETRALLTHLLRAARFIEKIYAQQRGLEGMEAQLQDPPSRALFWRNQGPWCRAPGPAQDPNCGALRSRPLERSGLYPLWLQKDPDFCQRLAQHPEAAELMEPFVAIQQRGGRLRAIPYQQLYRKEMKRISQELNQAALAIKGLKESALQRYLQAASQAFLDGGWFLADEAWAAMSAENSRWYLRVGPDETYFEPCSQKAGFHLSLARINPESRGWRQRLEPVKQEMEARFATLAAAPYQARTVSFQLPDFIEVVLNAGEARDPFGATIGQSLPNWGPVAREARGRTVAMTNLYRDPESLISLRKRVRSLLCSSSMAHYSDNYEPGLMSTLLHEISHNLGPASEYRVKGQKDALLFGGPLATTLEELKAQMGSLYFGGWLQAQGTISEELRDQARLRDIVWSFGHISQGMYTTEGRPRPYAQLAAIITARLIETQVLNWRPSLKADNGEDIGCFEVDLTPFAASVEGLMMEVLQIKAQGNRAAAEALKARYVDASGEFGRLGDLIRARWRRAPKRSFVYSIRY